MKITKIFALIFFAAAQIFAQESSEDSFNDIDFVQFGSSRKKTEYVIGENSQSVTAKRRIFPFKINRYETTYNLWYKVRLWAEENGYVFANPGQEGSSGARGKVPTNQRGGDDADKQTSRYFLDDKHTGDDDAYGTQQG